MSYFNKKRNREKFFKEVESWRGTPFRHRACVKGVGVDCVQLVGQVMCACGVASSYDFGRYQLDWALHSDKSKIVDYIESTGKFVRLENEPAQAGDVVCFKIAKCIQHAGLALDDVRFLHAFCEREVCEGRLDDSHWRSRFVCLYRAV